MSEASLESLSHLADKLRLEIAFAQPGNDGGLLPVNDLIAQLEELQASADLPDSFEQATLSARQCVDGLFEQDGLFTADSLALLTSWSQWFSSAVAGLKAGTTIPQFEVPRSVPATVPPSPSAHQLHSTLTDEASPVLNIEKDGELLREFVQESREHLQNIELGVLTLEDNPTDADTLNSIFRAFHTFKGGSGFLNLGPISSLAHELESLLDLARQHRLTMTADVTSLILAGSDKLSQFLAQMELRLAGQNASEPIVISFHELHSQIRARIENREIGAGSHDSVACPDVQAVASSAMPQRQGDELAGDASANGRKPVAASVVKVDTQKLDGLVDLVGEMVIAQSMVAQDPCLIEAQSPQLTRNLGQLARITRELQRVATSLRMVPIRATFQKMLRLVRDVSAKSGKQAELVMSGEDTELDRTIIEEISDPLVHMIRNAVDHGLEKPEARVAAGKTAKGVITLRAFHKGGSIVIEVSDDGAGLPKEKILAKAAAQGLVSPNAQLSDQDIFNLVFAPGFSTAEVVTDLSGRGVGMDVVRRNIEKLRGKIEIQSTVGTGSTFTIQLPLTLAIIDGLIVSVGHQRYILPTLSVRESFRLNRETLSSIHQRGEMINVRGKLIPLLRLSEYFGVEATPGLEAIVVVVESDHEQRGLLVDSLLGKQEVVIKSLGSLVKESPALAGAAILGDGRVGLILDVSTLVKLKTSPLPKAA